MKKRSQWIYILSVLLCLTILFASCDKDPADTDTETQTEITTQETQEKTTEEQTEGEALFKEIKNLY